MRQLLLGIFACGVISALDTDVVTYGVAVSHYGTRVQYFPFASALYGPAIPTYGMDGILVEINGDGCRRESIREAVAAAQLRLDAQDALLSNNILVLVPRGNCTFDTKTYMAQLAGANGVIVHDSPGPIRNDSNYERFPRGARAFDGLVAMTAQRFQSNIRIPSIFIAYDHGQLLASFARESQKAYKRPLNIMLFAMNTTPSPGRGMADAGTSMAVYMLILTVLFGIGSLASIFAAHMKALIDSLRERKRHKKLLAKLQKIPKRTLEAQDVAPNTLCPICLDVIEAGMTVHALPCRHIFHDECLGDWFQASHHYCPTCRQDVFKSTAVTCKPDAANQTSGGDEVIVVSVSIGSGNEGADTSALYASGPSTEETALLPQHQQHHPVSGASPASIDNKA